MDSNNEIEATLMAILRLLAAQAVQGKSLTDAVLLLDRAGMDRAVIAEICETSPGTVRALLSRARSGQKSRKKRGQEGKE